MRLREKVALVTGAGSGVGRAVAERFALEGADLALLDMNGAGLSDTTSGIGGVKIVPLQVDIGDTDAARAAVAEALRKLDQINILVNCAGIAIVKPFLEVTEEEYDRVQRTNIRGMYFLSQAVGRIMVEQKKGGRIIHIGSTAGESPFPQASIYAVSKGGVRQLTKSMAIELATHGITVNCIAPGHLDTPLSRKHITSDAVRDAMIASIPVGRLGLPSDVAGFALYLASDESFFANGEVFIFDGGNLAVGR